MASTSPMGKIADGLVKGVVTIIDFLVKILPEDWRQPVRRSRKAIVNAAGAVLSTLGFLNKIPFLPPQVSKTIGIGTAFATAITNYLVPNDND